MRTTFMILLAVALSGCSSLLRFNCGNLPATDPLPELLPFNERRMVEYSNVVEVPGASAAELHTRARLWASLHYVSGKAATDMESSEARTVVVKGWGFSRSTSATDSWFNYSFTVLIQSQDQRYRYFVRDILLEYHQAVGSSYTESFATAEDLKACLVATPPKPAYKRYERLAQELNDRLNRLRSSLGSAMTATLPYYQAW